MKINIVHEYTPTVSELDEAITQLSPEDQCKLINQLGARLDFNETILKKKYSFPKNIINGYGRKLVEFLAKEIDGERKL